MGPGQGHLKPLNFRHLERSRSWRWPETFDHWRLDNSTKCNNGTVTAFHRTYYCSLFHFHWDEM